MAKRKGDKARKLPKRRGRVSAASKRTRSRKPKVYNQDRYIIPALRKIWRYYPIRRQVLSEANETCAICKTRTAELQVDHIIPIGTCKREDGRTDYNKFIDSLLCQKPNLQAVCKPCHSEKTKRENNERRSKANK